MSFRSFVSTRLPLVSSLKGRRRPATSKKRRPTKSGFHIGDLVRDEFGMQTTIERIASRTNPQYVNGRLTLVRELMVYGEWTDVYSSPFNPFHDWYPARFVQNVNS